MPAGFDLVYDKSYPLGTQDYAPVIKAAKATNPDAFIAYSYPPDTFGLTDQAKIENFNVKVYYNGIGCAFAGFAGKYGASAENVIGFGGIPDNEKTRAFLKLHKEVTGIDSDYNACFYLYANGQVLTQAFEGAGTVDREAVTAYLKSHTFKTLIGEIDLRSQLQNIAYTVGQWQNGFFRSVAAVGVPESDLVPVGSRPAGHNSSLRQIADAVEIPGRRRPGMSLSALQCGAGRRRQRSAHLPMIGFPHCGITATRNFAETRHLQLIAVPGFPLVRAGN